MRSWGMVPNKRFLSQIAALLAFVVVGCSDPSVLELPADRWAARVPNPRASGNWVTDAVGVLDPAMRSEMNRLIAEVEKQTGAEVAVVILPDVEPLTPKQAATTLFNYWKIGKKGKDNGLLILHVTGSRRVEIEPGYGLEGTFPDLMCKALLDQGAVPYFKLGRFAEGHRALLGLVAKLLSQPQLSVERLLSPEEKAAFDLNLARHVAVAAASPGPEAKAYEQSLDVYQAEKKSLREKARDSKRQGWQWAALILLGISLFFYGCYRIISLSKRDPKAKYDFIVGKGESLILWTGRFLLISLGTAWSAWAPGGTFFILGGALVLAFIPLSVIGGELHRRFSKRRLEALRAQPRPCPQCGAPMTKLDDTADDKFLKTGQVTEERIQSLDYDVWVCGCGGQRVDKYLGHDPHDQCPKCQFMTQSHSRKVIQEANYDHSGMALYTYTCRHCRHVYTKSVTIPQLTRSSSGSGSSSSSSSDSSSSSRSDSYGGGSSGGGGAGSSY